MALYRDWVGEYGRRFLAEFDNIKAEFNFEYGDEFEIAVAKILRQILPAMFGVCRGYVMGETEAKGDDIVIFDVSRFPTFRSIGEDLATKNYVPVEGVLAYIEAKHTLYITEKKPAPAAPATGGQSLEKACAQVAAVKSMNRERVHKLFFASTDFPPGFPTYKNPLFGAVLARHIVLNQDQPERFAAGELKRLQPTAFPLPDLIAAGDIVVLPAIRNGSQNQIEVKPFHCSGTELVTLRSTDKIVFGTAMVQLLRALHWIELGQVPWHRILADAFNEGSGKSVPAGWGDPPIVGPE